MKSTVRIIVAVFFIASISPSYAQDTRLAGTDVSTVVRRQGYRCEKPITATKDAAYSIPDEEAWILNCKNATYRVRLLPHSLSPVEVLQSSN